MLEIDNTGRGKKYCKLLPLIVLSLVFVLNVSAAENKIHVGHHSIIPDKAANQAIDLQKNDISGDNRFIVQFESIPTSEERSEIENRNNLEFLSYTSNRAWIVKTEQSRKPEFSKLDPTFITAYRPKFKLGQTIEENGLAKRSLNPDNTANISIEFFKDVKTEKQVEIIEKHGKPVSRSEHENRWRIRLPRENYLKLTKENGIKKVENPPAPIQALNNVGRTVISADRLQDDPYNLTGEGFTVAMWDTGWAGKHPDISNKTEIGDKDQCSDCIVKEHATHVAGTMLGAGHLDNDLRGVAPETDLVTHEVTTADAILENTNDSARNAGAILTQNSWGKKITEKSDMGNYDFLSNDFDHIVRGMMDIPRTTVVFSAGNERGNWDIEYNTTTSYGATSKNTITVGAVDDSKDMTSYSSWGPTDDGRLKPELVADGGGSSGRINSTIPNSSSDYPYAEKQGTSMASPAVSGTAILLNEKFNKTYNRLPEPATTKGILIHTAEDLGNKGPDYKTGYGLVNATRAINYVENSDTRMIQRDWVNSTGASRSYSYGVTDSGKNISFTLVWSDYPAESSGDTLVNDLDLNITGPEGERHYPWTLEGISNPDAPASRDTEDHTNNVEQVYIENATSGEYSVKVEGHEIPYDQSFSLLTPEETAMPEITIYKPEGLLKEVTLEVSATKNISEWRYSINGAENQTFTPNTTIESLDDGEKNITVWGENEFGNWFSETQSFTLDTTPPEINTVKPENNSFVTGNFSLNISTSDNLTNVTEKEYKIMEEGVELQNGSYNTTINSSEFEDGNYSLNLSSEDFLGNINYSTIQLGFDNTAPNLSVNDTELKYSSGEVYVNASGTDGFSGLKKIEYRWEENGNNLTAWKQVNNTFDTEELEDSNYTLEFKASDKAGNTNTTSFEAFIDNKPPKSTEKLNLTAGNFTETRLNSEDLRTVNFTQIGLNWTSGETELKDETTGISHFILEKKEQVFYPENGSYSNQTDWQEIKQLNSSYQAENSTEVELDSNKKHIFSLVVVDEAGNRNRSNNYTVGIDQKAPFGDTGKPVDWINEEKPLLNATLIDMTGLDTVNFSVNLSSGNENITTETTHSYGNSYRAEADQSIELKNLTYYTASVEAEDRFGKVNNSINWSFRTDFNPPETSLNFYSGDKVVDPDKWQNSNLNAEISCSEPDNESGFEKSVLELEGTQVEESTSSEKNYTLSEEGSNTYSFKCKDVAGNILEKSSTVKIDTEAPEIESFSIENNSDSVAADTDIEGSLTGEAQESGINSENSDVEIEELDSSSSFSNNSFSIDANLSEGETYTVSGEIGDFAGNTESFVYSFTTEESTEEETSNDGSGGGGGGTLPTTSQEEQNVENTEEDETENNEESDEENETEEEIEASTEEAEPTQDKNVTVRNVTAEATESGINTELELENTGEPGNHTLEIIVDGETYEKEVYLESGTTTREVSIRSDGETESLAVNGNEYQVERKESSETDHTQALIYGFIFVLITGLTVSGAFIYRRRKEKSPEDEVRQQQSEHIDALEEELEGKNIFEKHELERRQRNERNN